MNNRIIEENSVFLLNWKKYFYEWSKIIDWENWELLKDLWKNIIKSYYVKWRYQNYWDLFLFFTEIDNKEVKELWDQIICKNEWIILYKPKDWDLKIENLNKYDFDFLNISYSSDEFYIWNACEHFLFNDWNFNSKNLFSFSAVNIEENPILNFYDYPWRDKNLKIFSKDFEKKEEEPPKKEDWNTTNIIKNETNTENQFFKDVESKNFDFKYKEIIKDWNIYMIQDNTDFQNYIWNKFNEFSLFIYVWFFFLFIFLSFNFIKNILWK